MERTATTVPDWLIGRWRLQRAEPGLEILPDTRMEFRDGGELVYTIVVEGKEAVFALTYRVEGDVLRTLQPDGGHRAAARFGLEVSGLLEFDFQGVKAWFARERLM